MTEKELKKYKLQLQLSRAILLEASESGASDYILLLGYNECSLAVVNKLLNITEDEA